jgi:hypothetical protein
LFITLVLAIAGTSLFYFTKPDAPVEAAGPVETVETVNRGLVVAPTSTYAPYYPSYTSPYYGNSSGCGSRGGPGWRLPNGKCASWSDGAYPPYDYEDEYNYDYDEPHCWTPRDCE